MEGQKIEFVSPKFKELKDLISGPVEAIKAIDLEDAFRAREINEQEVITLTLELLKRNEAELTDAKGMLKRYGIKEQRAKPRAPGEKGYIEVSEDGTQKAS